MRNLVTINHKRKKYDLEHPLFKFTKNEKDWFEKYEDTPNWVLTRGGELFVNDELPRTE